MDNATAETLKEQLMRENSSFKDLVTQHQKYEERLSLLSSLHYPSEEEQAEESTLKRKKLAVKDEIYAMLNEFSKSAAPVGH